MKNIFYVSLVILSLGFIKTSEAQVSVNINIGNQPLWGPVGYDYVRYYYLPELNVYYNVVNKKYTYWKKNRWVTKSKLPKEYNRFNLYRTYKVVINEPDPWRNHGPIHHKYRGYAHNYSQVNIREGRSKPQPNFKKSDRRRSDDRFNSHNRGHHNRHQRPKDSPRR